MKHYDMLTWFRQLQQRRI